MATKFELKIQGLEKEKSELDLTFLQSKKEESEKRISDLLAHSIQEGEEGTAVAKLNEIRECYSKIGEINHKINHIPEIIEEIDKKVLFYKEKREKVNNIPLYKNTEKGIIEILGGDPLYIYAKESGKEKLIKKLEERSLKPNEYTTHIENMYKELFKNNNKLKKEINQVTAKKNEILLPEGMSEQINEELKDSKDIKPQDIEKFLKNELKKNGGDIMLSHIKNTFKDKATQATRYIKKLIISYPLFKIIDNLETKTTAIQTKTKNEKLLSSITQEEAEEHKNKRIKINNLTFKLNEIGKIEDLKSRITKYLDLFEELNYDFTNREEFGTLLHEAITTHTHIEIEKEIIKTLNLLIQGNLRIEKTGLYKYNVFRFNRDSRRMLAYPNREIFTICSHEEYEKIINTQPPVDKIE